MFLDEKILLLLFGVKDEKSPRADEVRNMYKGMYNKLFLSTFGDYIKDKQINIEEKNILSNIFTKDISDEVVLSNILESITDSSFAIDIVQKFNESLLYLNEYIIREQVNLMGPTEIELMQNYLNELLEKDLNLNRIVEVMNEKGYVIESGQNTNGISL